MIKEDSLLLNEINYKKIGFKCGLEIHRRMKGKKLFCRCNANLSETENANKVLKIRRYLSLSHSEIGEIDKASLEEIKKGRYYEYLYYDKGCCLIDIDEEPPLIPIQETIERALKTAILFSCHIPPQINFMRKMVVDGSNPSGFQRTGIIGYKGKIKTSKGNICIETMCLEEESAQIISKEKEKVVYDLRRLGIPLIEIATSPDIKDPEHAKEVAEKIGSLLKCTGYYQRGLGSIRQDINISIKEGCRVEIKGVQELNSIPEIIKKEVIRQNSLIKLKNYLQNEKLIFSEVLDVSKFFNESRSKILRHKEVFMFSIKEKKGLFKIKITPTRTLGNEIAGYIKVKTPAKGFIHTDEDIKKYGINDEIKKISENKDKDLLIFVVGKKELANKVRKEIINYFNTLIKEGLKNETRQALDNNDTTFLRPLPGAARMYPETDIPPIIIKKENLDSLYNTLPPSPKQIIDYLTQKGINKEVISQFFNSKYFDLFTEKKEFFENATKEKINTLLNIVKDIERKEKIDVFSNTFYLFSAIEEYISGKISKEAFVYIVGKAYHTQNSPKEIIDKEKLYKITKEDIKKEIRKLGKKDIKNVIKVLKQKYGIRIEPKDVVEVLKNESY